MPVINPPACAKLVCNISGVGSADPNTGDTFTYLWNFGDGTPTSTSSAMSHTFPAAGTYTLTLTVTDGWGSGQHHPDGETSPPPSRGRRPDRGGGLRPPPRSWCARPAWPGCC